MLRRLLDQAQRHPGLRLCHGGRLLAAQLQILDLQPRQLRRHGGGGWGGWGLPHDKG